MYYRAVLLDSEGAWLETVGSMDKSDVDFAVQEWKELKKKGDKIKRKTFKRVPTQKEIEAWVRTL